MKKFTKKVQGSISLFLSMIILLLVILEGFLIDGSKVLASKMFMSSAGEMTLNAGLTYYDEALRDIYGLFAISESEEDLKANLKVHFQRTLGETTGVEDSGYVDNMLEYVENALKSGWDGEEAGRLLDLELGSFEAKGVVNSELSQPYVIKNQILEYMKYRGPASLGYGMLEKLHAFKELDKQQKTMEAKLDYEEKMSDIQEACENAYNNIEPYNRLLEGDLKPSTVEQVSLDVNKNMREAILATWCYSAAKRDFRLDKNWEKKVSSVTSRDVEGAINACRNLNAMSVAYGGATASLSAGFNEHPKGTMYAVKVTIGYVADYENFKKLYTTWENYLKYYSEKRRELVRRMENTDDEDEEDSLQEEIDELDEEMEELEELYESAETIINQCAVVLEGAQRILEEDIQTRMDHAVSEITRLSTTAKTLESLAENGKNELDNVIKEMDNLQTLGGKWQSTIDNLSDGDIKTSMQLDYSNKAKELDREKIRDLQEKLENGRSYAKMLGDAAKAAKATNYRLLDDGQKSNFAGFMKNKFENTSYNSETLTTNISFASFNPDNWTDRAKHSDAMKASEYTTYLISENGGKTSGDDVQMDLSVYTNQMDTSISAKNDEFFQYLERVCPKNEAEENAKKEAKETKKELLEKGGSADLNVSGLPTLAVNKTGAGGSGSGDFTKTSSDAEDKDVSKNAKDNSKASANFISGIGNLLVSGRDKLYLSEYATQMFSYYTVEKMEKASDKETLSGYPFNAKNNQMYQAEVEYILWGDANGSHDVSYTLATIFGIRFLLNSLYAFTGDPEIRQVSLALATSIAGWTGFGVPLVQSVIILGFALVETTRDIAELKDGKSVPIYKSQSNWVTKPTGITKELIHDTINKAGDAAKNYIVDELNNLTEETKEQFRNKLNQYTDDTIKDVVSAASATVLNPLQERIIGLVNVVSKSNEVINAKIGETVQGIREMIATEEDDSVMAQAKLAALDYFATNLQGSLSSSIQQIQNNTGMSSNEVTIKIDSLFKKYKERIESNIKSTVTPMVKTLSDEVESALDSGSAQLQEKTNDALNNMMMRIHCGVSFSEIGSDGSIGRTGGSAALTMNYKEYLWVFIAVKSVVNEEDILKRIGNLIQANLASSETKPSSDFDITKAYSFIEVNATADLSTTFFAMPVPVAGGGGVTLGSDKYSIGYKGVLGY